MISQLIKKSNICDNSHCFITKQTSLDCVNSSVAIILKSSSNSTAQNYIFSTQILFLKRKTSLKDRYSGQICFPGGKQEEYQNLYETAIRQTYQETHIQLKHIQFIGCLKEKIFVNYSIKKQQGESMLVPHYMYAFIFFVNDKEAQNLNIKLNPQEMEDYKWVTLQNLLKQQNRVFKIFQEKKLIPFIKNVISKNNQLSENLQVLSEITGIFYPAINIQMENQLYGLTFYTLYLFLYRLKSWILEFVLIQNQQGKNFNIFVEKVYSLTNYFNGGAKFLIKEQSQNKQKIILFQKLFIQQMTRLRPKL